MLSLVIQLYSSGETAVVLEKRLFANGAQCNPRRIYPSWAAFETAWCLIPKERISNARKSIENSEEREAAIENIVCTCEDAINAGFEPSSF